MDYPPFLNKGDGFCVFLFASLHSKSLWAEKYGIIEFKILRHVMCIAGEKKKIINS